MAQSGSRNGISCGDPFPPTCSDVGKKYNCRIMYCSWRFDNGHERAIIICRRISSLEIESSSFLGAFTKLLLLLINVTHNFQSLAFSVGFFSIFFSVFLGREGIFFSHEMVTFYILFSLSCANLVLYYNVFLWLKFHHLWKIVYNFIFVHFSPLFLIRWTHNVELTLN